MPELRHLRYFVAVAEALSFTQAAERLHIAQPALSATIRQLETELGVELLERTSRKVRLTSAGELLLERARATLASAEETFAVVRDAGRGLVGRVRIAASPAARYGEVAEHSS
jgi:DNA-binding transcriptional LysR family regulator